MKLALAYLYHFPKPTVNPFLLLPCQYQHHLRANTFARSENIQTCRFTSTTGPHESSEGARPHKAISVVQESLLTGCTVG